MKILNVFAERLKLLREEHKLTQSELAKYLDVSRGSISFYENKDRTPDIEFLDRASIFFNVPIDYLMGYTNSKIKSNVDLSQQIKLSDEALNKLKELSEYDADSYSMLNPIIEHKNFYDLLAACDNFITSKRYDELGYSDFIELFKSKLPSYKIDVYDAISICNNILQRILNDIYDNKPELYRSFDKLLKMAVVYENYLYDKGIDITKDRSFEESIEFETKNKNEYEEYEKQFVNMSIEDLRKYYDEKQGSVRPKRHHIKQLNHKLENLISTLKKVFPEIEDNSIMGDKNGNDNETE